MRKILRVVTYIDLMVAAWCWLILWFINGSQPDSGYRIVYIICMLHAAIMMFVLIKTKKIRRRGNAYGSR